MSLGAEAGAKTGSGAGAGAGDGTEARGKLYAGWLPIVAAQEPLTDGTQPHEPYVVHRCAKYDAEQHGRSVLGQ